MAFLDAMSSTVNFKDTDLFSFLQQATDDELDDLDFGVIGFDAGGFVRRYNSFESEAAGLSLQQVLGLPLFTSVAPCMNNFMVAQRFEDASEREVKLDVTIPYVLTLRMKPVKVLLRLLSAPRMPERFVVIERT